MTLLQHPVSKYPILTVLLTINAASSPYKGLLDPDPSRRRGGEEGLPGGPEALLQLRPLPGHGGPGQDLLSGGIIASPQ